MRKLLLSAVGAAAVMASLAGAATAQPFYGRPPVPGLRVEVRPVAPHPGWVWRPGYWNWAGGRYVWVGGLYVAPGVAYGHWVPGHWNRFGVWVPAHWVR